MKPHPKVLYISYNGALEEIVPTQVIPYLRELSKIGYNFILLTFEKKENLKEVGPAGLVKLRRELKAIGIEWHWLRYHKRLSLLATSFDVLAGTVYALYLISRYGIRVVHARSVVPAAMCVIPRMLGVKFIFDTRGLLAEEYVGGGHWREGCLKYKVVKFTEMMCLKLTDAVIVLTERHRDYLLNLPGFKNKRGKTPLKVIPCCTDLDRFRCSFHFRENFQEDFIFTYSGKIGKHYMLSEMLDFFEVAAKALPDSRLVILTSSGEEAKKIVFQKRLNSGRVIIKKPAFEEIPGLLSQSSAGVFFINPYKKFGSSPIKLGEFLSCGVPVIINTDIGDTEELVSKNKVGIVIDRFNEASYKTALCEFFELFKEGEGLRRRCRKVAEDFLSLGMGVEQYNNAYKEVAKCTVWNI